MDIEHIPTYEEYKANRVAERARSILQRAIYAEAYDPSQEADPDHEWFRLQHDNKDQEVREIVSLVTDVTEKARPEDTELLSLHKFADKMRDIVLDANTEVALVGQQGMGKSLLINALTNRRDLSKTSARIGACTASAIKYRHKSGVDDKHARFDAVVKFMDDECLSEIISEHARRYYHFHYSGNVDPEYQYEEQRAAETAVKFLEEISNAHFDVDAEAQIKMLLEKTNIMNGNLIEVAMEMAHERIIEAEADEDRSVSFEDMKIDELLQAVDGCISDSSDFSSLWPIVDNVIIYMGSTLARNGVVMIDLPGLGDLNQSRTAATNAIRRNAMFELIVAKSERVTTEEVVDQQIRQSIRAHGAKNTILVLTQIDQYFLDSHSVDNEINNSEAHPFPTIQLYQTETEKMLDELDIEGDEEMYEEIEHMQDYKSHLTTLAQCAFVKQRACEIEQIMCDRFMDEDPNPIRVFSVSASMYLDWIKQRQKSRPDLTPEMTGIPVLRRFLLGLPAEDNYKAYKEHVKVKLSTFLDKVRRVAHNEDKDNSYAIIRPHFQQLVTHLANAVEAAFENFINHCIEDVWKSTCAKEKRHASLLNIVSEWSNGVAWNTYNKAAREKGIVARTKAKKYVKPDQRSGSINWNEELSLDIVSDMQLWRCRMRKAVKSLASDLDHHILHTCAEIVASIMASYLDDDLKQVVVEEWTKHEKRILTQSKHCEKILRDSIQSTYKFATTETDIRCMFAKINWEAYTTVEVTQRGAGFSQLQRDRMYSAMKGPDSNGKTLPDHISSMVRKEAKKNLLTACDTIVEGLDDELQLFDDHIDERLPADYDLCEHDFRLRDALKSILPQLEDRVKQLGRELSFTTTTDDEEEDDGDDESGEDDVPESSKGESKSRREDNEGSGSTKRARTQGSLGEAAMHSSSIEPKEEEEVEQEELEAQGCGVEVHGNEETLSSNRAETFGMRNVGDE